MSRLSEVILAGVLIGLASLGGAYYLHRLEVNHRSVAETCVVWADKVCGPGNELCIIGGFLKCREYEGNTDKLEKDIRAGTVK